MDIQDRNPSPPPAISNGVDNLLHHTDNIGDTVFSQLWVFTTLMKLLKAVETESEGKDEEDKIRAETHGIDIDDDLENDLCKLWDMTANEEVALFLQEWKSTDILLSVIAKTNAPRVTEICMGILGNMVCCKSISEELSKNGELINLTLLLLSGADPPTLVETTRFLNSSISNPCSADAWLDVISDDEEVFQNLTFILQSSTNSDLLHHTVDLIDQILDTREELLIKWASPTLVDGLAETLKQVRLEKKETVGVILHVMQLISTIDMGVDCLVKSTEVLLPLLAEYLAGICEEEVVSVRGRERSLASAISVVDVVVNSSSDQACHTFQTDKRLLHNIIKIYQAFRKENGNSRETAASSDKPVVDEKPPDDSEQTGDSEDAIILPQNSQREEEEEEEEPVKKFLASSLATFFRRFQVHSEKEKEMQDGMKMPCRISQSEKRIWAEIVENLLQDLG